VTVLTVFPLNVEVLVVVDLVKLPLPEFDGFQSLKSVDGFQSPNFPVVTGFHPDEPPDGYHPVDVVTGFHPVEVVTGSDPVCDGTFSNPPNYGLLHSVVGDDPQSSDEPTVSQLLQSWSLLLAEEA